MPNSSIEPPEFDATRARQYLDPESKEALFQQVRRFLEQSLLEGRFRANRPLPSSRHLAGVLGVSRNTVNAAYQELVALGLVESRPRSGLYPIAQPALEPRAIRGLQPTPRTAPVTTVPTRQVDWAAKLPTPRDADLPHAAAHADWTRYPFPFLPGQPELRTFPARGWLRALNTALAGPHLAASVRDAVDDDDELLVDAIRREILPPRGISVGSEEIIVTSGAQQALTLLAELLVQEGTAVAVENPGYVDAWHIFRRAGAELIPRTVDAQGARRDEDGSPTPSLVYVTPSHQHPTNVTLSYPRRAALLREAQLHDQLVIEDDYDSEVRFKGRPTPSLKSLDRTGRVVYVGTFSKFVAPGIRLGFVVADAALIAALRERRRYATKHPPGHLQRALGLFIESGEYHRSLRQHRRHLARKWEVLTASLEEHLPFPLDPPAAGGLSVWVGGPPEFDGTRVTELARERGVLVDAGERFYLADPERRHVRIGFNSIALEAIPRGIEILGGAIRDQLAE
ncbi:aminotransferase class I/II-fold pyridoxal phosphate-dependent enzyme [Agromyces sp. MMS17-SY077]|uniref:Aminotransferase class I/II-fold pyridoxal phosphate-dependent enzyme n=2 Tax=Agromyces seonyuensis TaxID=2662446 RepID=A0A6I4NVM1_9MICO|nr:PLP-dependent aminotransferase family protein [Agromyces seonyuensis]MWB97152.1 aminotransferase class I/II-fold pyridoxal phosphate-dependent enzyme [Agromyces seonyuensis]